MKYRLSIEWLLNILFRLMVPTNGAGWHKEQDEDGLAVYKIRILKVSE
jgi:hypothetical protein